MACLHFPSNVQKSQKEKGVGYKRNNQGQDKATNQRGKKGDATKESHKGKCWSKEEEA